MAISLYTPTTWGILAFSIKMKNIKSEEMLHIVQHEMRTQHQIKVFDPYGFNNTYTIEMLCPHTEELGIEKISDLAKYPDLIAGFDKKFILRDCR